MQNRIEEQKKQSDKGLREANSLVTERLSLMGKHLDEKVASFETALLSVREGLEFHNEKVEAVQAWIDGNSIKDMIELAKMEVTSLTERQLKEKEQ